MTRPTEEGGGFLSRWARRKQEAALQAPVADAPLTATDTAALVPAPDATPPEKAPEQLPLPSLDDIVPGSNVTAFLQKHVPDALRTAALRKLWVTDPDIKDFIEMADYQWDFNNPDSIPGWSSKLEGIDVKAMAERIFAPQSPREQAAVVAEPAPEPAAVPADATDGFSAKPEEISNNAYISEASGRAANAADEPLIQNGAAQNNTKESSVYEVARKRHGGALPT